MPREKVKSSEKTRRHSEGDKRLRDEGRTENRREKSLRYSREDLSQVKTKETFRQGKPKQEDLTHERSRYFKEEEERQKKDNERVLKDRKDTRAERIDERLRKDARGITKEERIRQMKEEERLYRKNLGRHLETRTAENTDRKSSRQDQKDLNTKRKGRPESEPREVTEGEVKRHREATEDVRRHREAAGDVRRQGRRNDGRINHSRHKEEHHMATDNHASNMEHNRRDDRAPNRGRQRKGTSIERDEQQKQQQMEWQGEEQEVTAEELTDPQEVPRKGFFYEHDNRDTYVPQRLRPWRSQMMERKEFLEKRRFLENPNPRSWREREEHDWGRGRDAESRLRRHSSEEQYFRRGEPERRRRPRNYDDWEERESGRMELVSSRLSTQRRRVDRREGMEDRLRERSPARWRHDLFEPDEPTSQQVESKKKTWSSSIDDVWTHDKYEELVTTETETEPVPT